MLVKGQTFDIKWTRKNKEWYENKGYIFSEYGDCFNVKAEDLLVGSNQIVEVQCDFCGKIVKARWRDYLKCSKDGIYACSEHRQLKTSNKFKHQRIHRQYLKALNYCQDKGYILLTHEEDLDSCYSNIDYVCRKHGVMSTNLLALTQKHGCTLCSHEENAGKIKLDSKEVVAIVNRYDGTLINVEEYKGWNYKNLKMICPECGGEFTTSLNSFAKHNGQRCPECSNTESKGEYKVRQFLEKNNIKYYQQYRFNDCRYKSTLPFDFYIFQLNILIEYDGEHHYIPIKRGKMTLEDAKCVLEKIKIRDQIKNDYCKNNGIKLIRIPYWNYDNIEKILLKELN